MPPGHPIILIKSSKFKMATLSVKRSMWHVLLPAPSTKWPLNYLLCPGSQGNLFFPQTLKARHPGFYNFRAHGLL